MAFYKDNYGNHYQKITNLLFFLENEIIKRNFDANMRQGENISNTFCRAGALLMCCIFFLITIHQGTHHHHFTGIKHHYVDASVHGLAKCSACDYMAHQQTEHVSPTFLPDIALVDNQSVTYLHSTIPGIRQLTLSRFTDRGPPAHLTL